MHFAWSSSACALIAILTSSFTLPATGFLTGASDISTYAPQDISSATVPGLALAARDAAVWERDLNPEVDTLNTLRKRKGGGGRGGKGGSGSGKGGRSSFAPTGRGPGGREGGRAGEGANGGPPRGYSPHEITGMRTVGGRSYGSGYGRGGIGGGFAGLFLTVAVLTALLIDVGPSLLLEANYIYFVTAMVGYERSDTVKYMPGFQNSNSNEDKEDKWPRYDQRPPPQDGNQTVKALWSLRTFSDTSCGNNGNNPYGTGSGKHGQPTMISEYISTDLNYHDNKACENFMVLNDAPGSVIVQSVATWFDPSFATPPGTIPVNPHQGVMSIYSDPLCRTNLDPSRTSANAPNGTVHTTYSDDFPDYMQIYSGVGLVNGAGNEQVGQWVCYQMQANAFHIVFANITNNKATLTGVNGTVGAADTLPPPGKDGPHDVFADRGGGAFLTNNITETFQVALAA